MASGQGFTRRRLLARGFLTAGALALGAAGGYIGYHWPHPSTSSESRPSAGDVASFVTRPDLSPPEVTMSVASGARVLPDLPRQVFIAPRGSGGGAPGQQGLMVLGPDGMQWFRATEQPATNLRLQTYQGRQVLTWWEGQIGTNYGVGVGQIIDSNYESVATVPGGNGLQADLHEFPLTPAGTALLTAYQPVQANLQPIGGLPSGPVLDGVALEVDVATGQVLFEWHSLDHVAVTETYAGSPDPSSNVPFDYFHINSIDVAPDGDLLISARNTWAVYKVARSTGAIVWRLNGKLSDFAMAQGSQFFWQHDARAHGATMVSIFDNGGSAEEAKSRGIVLDLDLSSMRATLQRQFTNPKPLQASTQGNVQLQPDGGAFVGWGTLPYFSLVSPQGALQLAGRMPNDVQSYRAFLESWAGTPAGQPAVVVRTDEPGGSTIYVSWNGATEVAMWEVSTGDNPLSLEPVGRHHRTGFETTIWVSSTGPYFQIVALDSASRELGRSEPVVVSR